MTEEVSRWPLTAAGRVQPRRAQMGSVLSRMVLGQVYSDYFTSPPLLPSPSYHQRCLLILPPSTPHMTD